MTLALRPLGALAMRMHQAALMRDTPAFATNHVRYAWLNQVQAVATGVVHGDDVVFEVSEVL